MKIAFFGTDEFAEIILNKITETGFKPDLLICAPDKPMRRNKGFVAPETKTWAENNSTKILQPHKLDEDFINTLKSTDWDLFIVASYGMIIPQSILDIPTKGTFNVHPSLLPKYRGASPIETAIIEDTKETGVTIMLMDSKMDHGPIIEQEVVNFHQWDDRLHTREVMAEIGGELLSNVILRSLEEEIVGVPQNHEEATFTKLLKKEDAQINLDDNAYVNYRKYLAFKDWLKTWMIINGTRVVVEKAEYKNGEFKILEVTPEGKKTTDWKNFSTNFIK